MLFDQFTQLTDLFNAGDADEAGDYLNALQDWDAKLRRINGTSVRGPNHAGPLTAEPISVREQILGFKTTGPTAVSLDQSLQEFRAYLQLHRQTNYFNPLNPSLQLEFSTEIADDSMFPATGSEWNMRIASISVDLLADQGFSSVQVANVGLIESGTATLRTYWANPPFADQFSTSRSMSAIRTGRPLASSCRRTSTAPPAVGPPRNSSTPAWPTGPSPRRIGF